MNNHHPASPDRRITESHSGIDHSLGLACIGYGSLHMLQARNFILKSAQTPARLILAEPDPVAFCVAAMQAAHPDWMARLDAATRNFIQHRLMHEAERTGPAVAV